jgi:class 3 adenylate cyclase
MALTLTTDERTELERRVRSRKIRSADGRRAQEVLMLADGDSFTTVASTLGCSPDYINRWRRRFETERLPGLRAKYRGQPATVRTPDALSDAIRIALKTHGKGRDAQTEWRKTNWKRGLEQRRPA